MNKSLLSSIRHWRWGSCTPVNQDPAPYVLHHSDLWRLSFVGQGNHLDCRKRVLRPQANPCSPDLSTCTSVWAIHWGLNLWPSSDYASGTGDTYLFYQILWLPWNVPALNCTIVSDRWMDSQLFWALAPANLKQRPNTEAPTHLIWTRKGDFASRAMKGVYLSYTPVYMISYTHHIHMCAGYMKIVLPCW